MTNAPPISGWVGHSLLPKGSEGLLLLADDGGHGDGRAAAGQSGGVAHVSLCAGEADHLSVVACEYRCELSIGNRKPTGRIRGFFNAAEPRGTTGQTPDLLNGEAFAIRADEIDRGALDIGGANSRRQRGRNRDSRREIVCVCGHGETLRMDCGWNLVKGAVGWVALGVCDISDKPG